MSNILADFLVAHPNGGYFCRYGNFYIDPRFPVHTAVISHAHGDHATPGHANIYTTAATAIFMEHRFKRQPIDTYYTFGYHQEFEFNGVHLIFIPAGHILGSAQILMTYKGVSYLYTGDYKLQEDATCEPIEVVHADVLITETTFANPDVSHPNPISEINKLNAYPHNMLLGTYALGKAQRLTQLINQYCPEKEVLVHHTIHPIHKLYEQFGTQELSYKPYNRKDMKSAGTNKIYMVPPMTFNSYFRANNVLRVFASGWNHLHRQNDIDLYISDHVDWKDILTYIDAVKPREIWSVHGDGKQLEKYFSGITPVRNVLSLEANWRFSI